MKIADFGGAYSRTAATACVLTASGSFTSQVGEEILAMARAYAEDGSTFLTAGDLVNAAAAFSYGLGWLDAGKMLGVIGFPPFVLPQIEEEDGAWQDPLAEKTARYRTLLDCALNALEIAPDRDTIYARAADAFLAVAGDTLSRGRMLEEKGCNLPALLQYSYGFGWVDAGVRAGLFRIRAHREIFTV